MLSLLSDHKMACWGSLSTSNSQISRRSRTQNGNLEIERLTLAKLLVLPWSEGYVCLDSFSSLALKTPTGGEESGFEHVT